MYRNSQQKNQILLIGYNDLSVVSVVSLRFNMPILNANHFILSTTSSCINLKHIANTDKPIATYKQMIIIFSFGLVESILVPEWKKRFEKKYITTKKED